MAIAYTKKMMIERLRRHIADGWPGEELSITSNEMLLYIDTEAAATMVGNSFAMAKIEGVLTTPEAYIVTTQLAALVQDLNTGEWTATLPQTPISLPLGYSITNLYFTDSQYGQSQPIYPIKTQRAAYRNYMPKPSGVSYRVQGDVVYVRAKDNSPLSNLTTFVEMTSTRTADVNDSMNLPDDVLSAVFDKVLQKCMNRILNIPKDVVKDNISAGNKSS